MEENKNIIKDFSTEREEQAWQNILTGIRVNERKKKQRRFKTYSAIAATIVLAIFGLITYNAFFKPDVYLAGSQNPEIKLADGSVVILSQGGKLTVEKSFPSDTRDVFLEGDAMFNVTKSKKHPFIVHGKGYETKVLGTIFKVSQSGKTFKVDLLEGKVLVYKTDRPKDPVSLAPKQTFTNYGISEAVSVSETTDKNLPASKDRSASLTFNECSLKDVIHVIGKTYGINLQSPEELENKKISISISNANAEIFIQALASQFNLKINKKNDSTFELEN